MIDNTTKNPVFLIIELMRRKWNERNCHTMEPGQMLWKQQVEISFISL